MAGFYAAHGVWSVADGETLIPMLGYVDADGGQGMDRLVFDDVGDAARAARPLWKRDGTAGSARHSSSTPTSTSTGEGSTR